MVHPLRIFACYACNDRQPCVLIAPNCDGRVIPVCPFGLDAKMREAVVEG